MPSVLNLDCLCKELQGRKKTRELKLHFFYGYKSNTGRKLTLINQHRSHKVLLLQINCSSYPIVAMESPHRPLVNVGVGSRHVVRATALCVNFYFRNRVEFKTLHSVRYHLSLCSFTPLAHISHNGS